MLALARALRLPLITHLRGYDVTRSRAALLASGRPGWSRYALQRGRLHAAGRPCSSPCRTRCGKQAIALGFPAERTRTHYNGVDLDRFQPGKRPREPGTILHVGRLVEKKGTADLIAALARTRRASRLVVIGDGPLRAAARSARRARSASRRSFSARRMPDEVAEWMRRATLLVAPSVTARGRRRGGAAQCRGRGRRVRPAGGGDAPFAAFPRRSRMG